ncbi:hypothetical protein BGW37DRAFT_508359 [Umbelopsis sp. PMI_123]|nr:hypothetical protein BGW37DRAFT_508359 [Umbelopsis sp. PMI_123]
MRRKQVNMQYVPTRTEPDPVIQRPSITVSLQEITQCLTNDNKSVSATSSKSSFNGSSAKQHLVDTNSALEAKTDVASGTEKQPDTKQIVKEMLDWKHKYHALENETQKQALQAEENAKRLEERFHLELAAAVEVHKAKIEEISEELQRLVAENQAFRNHLASHNIEPVTALIDTHMNNSYCIANEDMKFIKDAHQDALSSSNVTTDCTENLKYSIENTVQVVEYELNLLKIGYLVPRDELLSLAKDHHERSAGQFAKDTLMKAIPGLFVRRGSDRRKPKIITRSDNTDAASIRSVDTTYTTSSRTTIDTRISLKDNRRNSGEYIYTDDNGRMPKSSTTNSGLRSLLVNNHTNIDGGLETDDDASINESEDIMLSTPSPFVSQKHTPYVLRTGTEPPHGKQGGFGWTKRKNVLGPTDALPPSMSSSQSCPSHLHR